MSRAGLCISVRVVRKCRLAEDIALFEMAASDGGVLPAFTAGSHIDVLAPDGSIRQYSLCNAPSETHRYQIAVLKVANGRGGSVAMHDQLNAGDMLAISHPRNHFPLAETANSSLLLAGGIGLTPLISMCEALSSEGHRFDLHVCSRTKKRTPFVERLLSSSFSDRVDFHFDDGAEPQRFQVDSTLGEWREGRHLYVCGPSGFMDSVLESARRKGWREDHIHYERFTPPTLPTSRNSEAFEVEIASSGKIISVLQHQSVVAALAAEGINIPTSCEQGICGTCLTKIISGEPDHRDSYLTPSEQAAMDQFLPCCSRSKSRRLVLDL